MTSNMNFDATDNLQEFTSFDVMCGTGVDGRYVELPDDVLRGIYNYGWERPSQIQSKAVVPLMLGRDLIAQAQSGTGKTGAFTIGLLSRIDPSIRGLQGMIVLNTKELALQVYDVVEKLSELMNIRVNLFMGNVPIGNDIRAIKNGCQVAIGTPGRICDLLNKEIMRLDTMRVLIVDEAHVLLSKGFKENINQICKSLPSENCNIGIFSATVNEEVLELVPLFMIDPVKILVKKENVSVNAIDQYFVKLKNDEWKFATLCDFYEKINKTHTIIFVNSTNRCQKLADDLTARDFSVGVLYGKMVIEERKRIMDDFRKGNTRILITTDLLCHGIDIQSLNLVINYDIPPYDEKENYIHRIGRAGRFGKRGVAISFISLDDEQQWNQIVRHYALNVKTLPKDYYKFI